MSDPINGTVIKPLFSNDVPEPTSYPGRNFIELDFSQDIFKPELIEGEPEQPQPPRRRVAGSFTTDEVRSSMRAGFRNTSIMARPLTGNTSLRLIDTPTGSELISNQPINSSLANLDPSEIAEAIRAGRKLNVYTSLFGTLVHNYIPETVEIRPSLVIIESYRLTSFLGAFGAGRTLKTFSLLPGEKSKISLRSFTKTESEKKRASSILDSFTEESSEDFENSIAQEVSDKKTYERSFSYYADAEAKASWGFGSAKVSGGIKGGTNSAREEFAKNVSNATQKHASKASSKRDVQIDTSYEVTETSEQETSIEREISNVNMSRTLNFIFRQMNQEFITLLHLTDVRVAYFDGRAETRKEVPISQLGDLLSEVLVEDASVRSNVEATILKQLKKILDYRDKPHNLIEEKRLGSGDRYTRIKRDLISTYKHPVTGSSFRVEGVILSASHNVMRTEGVAVESVLGEGIALDSYAAELQRLEVSRRSSEAGLIESKTVRANLINRLVDSGDSEKIDLIVKLCKCDQDAVIDRPVDEEL